MGQVSADALMAFLESKFETVAMILINSEADLVKINDFRPDLVFLTVKYIPLDADVNEIIQRKIWLADYLDENGITYTGSNSMAHKLELNKGQAKTRVLHHSISTAPFFISRRISPSNGNYRLNFPLFVKPLSSGGGNGIDSNSLVHNNVMLDEKLQNIHTVHQADAIVEEYLPGREFTVGLFKSGLEDVSYHCMPLELFAPLDTSGVRILTSQVKSSDTETPAFIVEDPDLRSILEKFALRAFDSLGARDYGRIDIRLSERGEPYFLEANLIPSIINDSGNFAKACKQVLGMTYEEMIMKIINLAFERELVTA